MKETLLSIILTVNISCSLILGQDNYYQIKPVSENIGLAYITKLDDHGISLSHDTLTFEDCILFWRKFANNWKSEIIDTVGIPPYGSKLHIFKSYKTAEFLILCESETEYYSLFNIYYLNKDLLSKVGTLPIQYKCKNCEDWTYPIEKIKIKNVNNEIEIRLLKPFLYDLGQNNWQSYSNKVVYFTIDKIRKKLIKH